MTWNRLLSPAEIQLLNANPYCMFRQPTDIGAFEYVSAAPAAAGFIPIIMNHLQKMRAN